MNLFKCAHCGQLLYFENYYCESCKMQLGFNPETLDFLPIINDQNGTLTFYNPNIIKQYHYCNNRVYNVCNWLVTPEDPGGLCKACELNHTIPNLNKNDYLNRWQTLEIAKHRLVYSLLRLGLPLTSKTQDSKSGLQFDFKADGKKKVLTGHASGIITINISEADDIEREMARRNMQEVYRTVLGHFRHEVGHYYWDRLIRNSDQLQHFRQLFGDEQKDYGKALKAHYKHGAPADWSQRYISAYASSHPWEDWAETWAHYLHIVDTLETAYAFGLSIQPTIIVTNSNFNVAITENAYYTNNFETIITLWLPLTAVLNSLNRSMGIGDAYPFVISPSILEKLKFIHNLAHFK